MTSPSKHPDQNDLLLGEAPELSGEAADPLEAAAASPDLDSDDVPLGEAPELSGEAADPLKAAAASPRLDSDDVLLGEAPELSGEAADPLKAVAASPDLDSIDGNHDGVISPEELARAPAKQQAEDAADASRGTAVPLVRFGRTDDDWLQLQVEGLELLRSLAAPVRIVAFLGQSRCGKSTTCSKLSEQRFIVGHDHNPVTQGADIAVVPVATGGSLVYIDCEGSRNPLAERPVNYHVLALLVFTLATEIVHCDMAMIQETSLQDIAGLVEARNMIMTASIEQYKPALRLLVTSARFGLPDDFCRALFGGSKLDKDRTQQRLAIEDAFASLGVVSVPSCEAEESYAAAIAKLQKDILDNCRPVKTDGMELSGSDIAQALDDIVNKIKQWSRNGRLKVAIQPDSTYQRVVELRLKASAESVKSEFAANLPSGPPWPEPDSEVARYIARFDEDTHSITNALKPAFREELERDLKSTLGAVMQAYTDRHASEKEALDAVADAMWCSFQLAMDERTPSLRVLSKEELTVLDRQLESYVKAFLEQAKARGLGDSEELEGARARLQSELSQLVSGVKEVNERHREEQERKDAAAQAERDRLSAERLAQSHLQERERRRRSILQNTLMAAGIIGVAAAVPAEWRAEAGPFMRSSALRLLGVDIAAVSELERKAELLGQAKKDLQEKSDTLSKQQSELEELRKGLREKPSTRYEQQSESEELRKDLQEKSDRRYKQQSALEEPRKDLQVESDRLSKQQSESEELRKRSEAPQAMKQLKDAEPEEAKKQGSRRQFWRRRWTDHANVRRPSLGALTFNPEMAPWALSLASIGGLVHLALWRAR